MPRLRERLAQPSKQSNSFPASTGHDSCRLAVRIVDVDHHGAGCGDVSSDYWIPDPFMKSCQAHDQCYENQCGKGTCDTQFYDDMKKERPNLPYVIPWVYYKAVDLFGDGAYKSAGKGR